MSIIIKIKKRIKSLLLNKKEIKNKYRKDKKVRVILL